MLYKVNHLSYIGDSFIGENSNIGAGTITANYDGYKKSSTEIGSGTSIGSNSVLVAPVKIGDQAVVGAGSVVRENIPDNSLFVGSKRGDQKIIKGWPKEKKKKNT